jgi:hypothetical protein
MKEWKMVTKNDFNHIRQASRSAALGGSAGSAGTIGTAGALVVGVLAVMVLAACSAGRDPLSGTSANQAAQQAVTDLKAAPTVTMDGTVSQGGTSYTIDLQTKTGTGCSGTVGEAGKGSLALVVIGKTVWIKPDDTMWKALLGNSQGSAAIALIDGRYLKSSASDASSLAPLISLCDPDTLVSGITKSADFTKGTITTVNGERVLPLEEKAHGGTMDVTDESIPEIAQLSGSSSGDTGKIDFTEGTAVTVTAPPASQTLNGSELGF